MKAAVPSFRPDGTVMDLAAPLPSDIVWSEIAAGLSKIARWNGRHKGPAFSVAQHCVMGADAAYAETGNWEPAAYFLLHDAHEAVIGDIVRPTVALIEHIAGRRCGIQLALQSAKATIDAVVFKAARLVDLSGEDLAVTRQLVKAMDERMLRAEAIALFGPQAAEHVGAADLPPPRLVGAIRPWGAMKAEEAWLDRLNRFLGINARAA